MKNSRSSRYSYRPVLPDPIKLRSGAQKREVGRHFRALCRCTAFSVRVIHRPLFQSLSQWPGRYIQHRTAACRAQDSTEHAREIMIICIRRRAADICGQSDRRIAGLSLAVDIAGRRFPGIGVGLSIGQQCKRVQGAEWRKVVIDGSRCTLVFADDWCDGV